MAEEHGVAGGYEIYFYKDGGERLGTYYISGTPGNNIGFYLVGHDPVLPKGLQAERDRLGSRLLSTTTVYLPYGEEYTPGGGSVPPNGQDKFGTYQRDVMTGLDYAVNRYYSSQTGRFLTADPYKASGGPGDPGSWNRYSYVSGDPVNSHDPGGLQACPAGSPFCITVSDSMPGPLKELLINLYNKNQQSLDVYLENLIIARDPRPYAVLAMEGTTFLTRGRLQQAIGSLSRDCIKALQETSAGGNNALTALVNRSDSLNFVSELGVEGSLSLAQVSGLNPMQIGGNPSVAQFAGLRREQARAVGNTALAARAGNAIILMSEYFQLSVAEQNAVLVHEGLHAATGLQNDVTLAQRLGIAQPGWAHGSLQDQGAASDAIHSWLGNDCPR